VRSSFLDIPHDTDNPVWQGGMRANGLEQSCPAEAGKLSRTLRHAGGAGNPGSLGTWLCWMTQKPVGRRAVERGSGSGPCRGVEPATLCLKAPVSGIAAGMGEVARRGDRQRAEPMAPSLPGQLQREPV
jgi:hypothetical protein